MRLLAIDPSSRSIGWSFFVVRGLSKKLPSDPEIVVKGAGIITERGADVLNRVVRIIDRIDEVIEVMEPSNVVIEVPSGKVVARHGGGGSGLAVYGFATGAIWQVCRSRGTSKTQAVTEAWTGGHSKERRRKVALKAYPALADLKDPGYDISDAVALGVWWLEQQRMPARKDGRS